MIGLVVLILAGVLGHDILGEVGERVATVIGSFFIIFSHYKNYSNCYRHRCEC